jgi:peptide/nickel transport system permease protein
LTGYILRRVGQAVIVMVGVSIIVFLLVHLVPGDPIRRSLGTRFDQDVYDALYRRAGFDRPLVEQYFRWVGNALQGDLGVSFRSGRPVTALVAERLPATAFLAGSALLLALVIALPAGIISAVRSGSALDRVVSAVSQVGVSIPDFWSGIMLILVFSLTLGWLPPSGYVSPLNDLGEFLRRITLPAITVGIVSGSILTRFVRSAMLDALNQDYTRTARAKGLRQRTVINRHVLKNALVPIVTVTGLQLAFLLGGVVVVEVIFAWPGLGRLALDAVERRDYPVLQGAVLLFSLTFLVVNLIVDLLYAYLDPRIRY